MGAMPMHSGRSGCASRFRPGFRGVLVSVFFCLFTPLGAEGVKGAPKAKGDREFGEYLSSLCVTCHQISGKVTGGIPPIVAWPEDQFIAVINSYRWKDRDNLVMQTVTAQLTDEEIAALAAYFGALTAQPDVK